MLELELHHHHKDKLKINILLSRNFSLDNLQNIAIFSRRQCGLRERPGCRRRPLVRHHVEAVHLEPRPLRLASSPDWRTDAEQI